MAKHGLIVAMMTMILDLHLAAIIQDLSESVTALLDLHMARRLGVGPGLKDILLV